MSTDERMAEYGARDGARRLKDKIVAIDRRSKAALSTGLNVPVVDADPVFNDIPTMWLLSDGRLRFYMPDGTVRQVTSAATGSATSAVTTPVDPEPTRQTATYYATGAVCICEVHGVETGPRLSYGIDSGQHGNRRIVVMFDAPTIQSDLTGAVVRNVDLSMFNSDADDETVDVAFGTHALTTLPTVFTATRRNVYVDEWPKVGTGELWRQTGVWLGAGLQAGTVTGLTIEQPPGSLYRGQMLWQSLGLRVTYTA